MGPAKGVRVAQNQFGFLDGMTMGTDESPNEPTTSWGGYRWLWPVLFVVMVLTAAGLGLGYYVYALPYEWTDDAFIEGDVVLVSPQVSGQVLAVCVDANQEVKAGDLLVAIDPEYYEAQLAFQRESMTLAEARLRTGENMVELTNVTTEARLQQVEAELAEARAVLETAWTEVLAARAVAKRAEEDFTRYDTADESVFSQQEKDRAAAVVQVARARLAQAGRQVAAAEAGIGAVLGRLADAESAPQKVAVRRSEAEQYAAEVEVKHAALRQAELDLEHTKVYAPVAGRVTRKSVNEGEQVQVGQRLMAIVPKEVWVIANFKETQLERMKPGQPVEIRVDAYGGRVFKGHVDSLQAGTGARFSLFPPENATGNYVKVVQRLPVKIVFDEAPSPDLFLVPGMSVVPKVHVQ